MSYTNSTNATEVLQHGSAHPELVANSLNSNVNGLTENGAPLVVHAKEGCVLCNEALAHHAQQQQGPSR